MNWQPLIARVEQEKYYYQFANYQQRFTVIEHKMSNDDIHAMLKKKIP